MAYTPELDIKYSQALRRIAWALEVPMTKAQRIIFDWIVNKVNKQTICDRCRDNTRCNSCFFKH